MIEEAFHCSPDGIRTRATALRGRRPRPLDDGAKVAIGDPKLDQRNRPELDDQIARICTGGRIRNRIMNRSREQSPLGYQDSNLEWLNQNQQCCRLHHTPMTWASEPRFWMKRSHLPGRDVEYQKLTGELQIGWSATLQGPK